MVERIIDWSARNKFLVLLLCAAAFAGGLWAMRRVPLDAIPDLSDVQVIVYSRWDRSPDIIEDQVTYPIASALLGAPHVKAVRGTSDFGYSYVYVVFEDGTDLYWARSRVLELLSKILPRLPEGVRTEIGPDATSVGWVFQYALVDRSGGTDLAQLRSLQDWYLRYQLQAVPGVAEVAAVGGFVKQYQVSADPQRLLAYGLGLPQVVDAIRKSNGEVGGRLLEMGGAEYMVRGRGYLKSVEDIENTVVSVDAKTATPILVRDVARVATGPEMRRGVADLDGEGDTVGGIVVMRQGENALAVIDRVKAALAELSSGLPPGVEIVPVYDRSDLIRRAIDTLLHSLVEEMVIVSLVILVFLWHVPSAIIPIVTIPVSVVLAFLPMWFLGVTSNIMSLSGIAISIGVLVDGAIVEVENAYKRLEEWIAGGRQGDFHEVRLQALREVGPSVFFSLLVIAVPRERSTRRSPPVSAMHRPPVVAVPYGWQPAAGSLLRSMTPSARPSAEASWQRGLRSPCSCRWRMPNLSLQPPLPPPSRRPRACSPRLRGATPICGLSLSSEFGTDSTARGSPRPSLPNCPHSIHAGRSKFSRLWPTGVTSRPWLPPQASSSHRATPMFGSRRPACWANWAAEPTCRRSWRHSLARAPCRQRRGGRSWTSPAPMPRRRSARLRRPLQPRRGPRSSTSSPNAVTAAPCRSWSPRPVTTTPRSGRRRCAAWPRSAARTRSRRWWRRS